jgi:hypothetical protein
VAPHKAQVAEPLELTLTLPINRCQHKELKRNASPFIVEGLPNSVFSNDSFLGSTVLLKL